MKKVEFTEKYVVHGCEHRVDRVVYITEDPLSDEEAISSARSTLEEFVSGCPYSSEGLINAVLDEIRAGQYTRKQADKICRMFGCRLYIPFRCVWSEETLSHSEDERSVPECVLPHLW